ncbi:hypothetical protein CANTEDRAFT_103843 [Yamadazyma tenuis ATCC 10573]|uniref:BTB domain-containing protein n=2 Tax=Candida tenuis TaxID=2315449 RepID=G3B1R7_CANTC|nr:uncharacterized protein CANTEDRAFT_103843 [Yamadazyma tenuis ATCC 10573]EGV64513.1 hypothetical protein CANTEDRAFT_103843 [Yamadazyma tenuis ATCC 10573]
MIKCATSPAYNYHSTLTQCTGTDTLFLYGGFDDSDQLDSNVYLFDTKTRTWQIDKSHQGLFREGHSASYIGNGNILVFGGVPLDDDFSLNHGNVSEQEIAKRKSLMLIYNIYSKTWITPPEFVLKNAPRFRSRHACCVSPDGNKMYFHGGLLNSSMSLLNDLYSYDLSTGSWDGPYKFVYRFHHSIFIFNGKLFSFGGLNENMNHVSDKIAFFDLQDHTTGEISISSKNGHFGSNIRKIYLGLDESIKLDVTYPSSMFKLRDSTLFQVSYYNLKQLKYVSVLDSSNLKSLFRKTYNEDITNFSWITAVISDHGCLLLFGCKQRSYGSSTLMSAETVRADNHINATSNADEEDELTDDEEMVAESEDETAYEFDDRIIRDSDIDLVENGNISVVLSIPLEELGIKLNDPRASTDSLLQADMGKFLESQEFTDFKIYCFKETNARVKYLDNPEMLEDVSMFEDGPDNCQFEVLNVHRMILLARWPYFRRLIESGMSEAKLNKMFIPEPSCWVKAMIYYLYTGSVEFESLYIDKFTYEDYSGVLILSNFYELIDLRTLMLNKLYDNLDSLLEAEAPSVNLQTEDRVRSILNMWCNVFTANETLLVEKLAQLIKASWSTILESPAFAQLPKSAIVKLTQICTVSEHEFLETPKKHSRTSIINSDNGFSSTLETPEREGCNSPFLQTPNSTKSEERQSPNVGETLSQLPVLQHLSNLLHDSIDD